MPKVILYGGSFNPCHFGHVFAACYLSQLGLFDQILVVPVHTHPDGKTLVPYEHRYEMCRMAMTWIPKVIVSDIESAPVLDGPNYTAKTAALLKKVHPDWDLHFAVGSDSAADINRWAQSEELLRLAKPFVITRSGYSADALPAVLPKISSTEIRASLKKQLSPKIAEMFLPTGLLEYITENKLYLPNNITNSYPFEQHKE